MKQRTDEELVRDCLQGNQDAWVTLIRRYRHLIHAVIRSYHLPENDGADVFQSVCLELFNSLSRLREVKALRRWLITVTSRQCLRVKRSAGQLDGDAASFDVEFLPDPQAADRFTLIERQQMLREALDELPSRCREMIELLFMKEPPIPYAELASRLSLAVGSIGFIRKRCLSKLKAELEKLGF
jgi:RNA polymerase sigma factor (sigma-70 family)